MNDVCMTRYESMHEAYLVYFSPFTLYQTYFNWSPICCYF